MSKQSSRGAAWERLRLSILHRDGWVCVNCGTWLESGHTDPQHVPTVDHIIAKQNGGTDDADNLVSMCLTCNGRKQDRIESRVAWFNPRWLAGLTS